MFSICLLVLQNCLPFVSAKAGTEGPPAAALRPGSRFARPGHENVDSRFRGNEWSLLPEERRQ